MKEDSGEGGISTNNQMIKQGFTQSLNKPPTTRRFDRAIQSIPRITFHRPTTHHFPHSFYRGLTVKNPILLYLTCGTKNIHCMDGGQIFFLGAFYLSLFAFIKLPTDISLTITSRIMIEMAL